MYREPVELFGMTALAEYSMYLGRLEMLFTKSLFITCRRNEACDPQLETLLSCHRPRTS